MKKQTISMKEITEVSTLTVEVIGKIALEIAIEEKEANADVTPSKISMEGQEAFFNKEGAEDLISKLKGIASKEDMKALQDLYDERFKKELVVIQNNQVVTSSRMVAEEFGKQHKNVLRDIEQMKSDMEADEEEENDFDLMFYETTLPDSYNRPQRVYLMNKEGFTLLTLGFTGAKALRFKRRYVRAFEKMEAELKRQSTASYMIEDPIKRAERWIEEQKEKQVLEVKNKELEHEVKVNNERIANKKILYTTTMVAKKFGLTAQKLNNILQGAEIIYKKGKTYYLYANYTGLNLADYGEESGIAYAHPTLKWTAKGYNFLIDFLLDIGYETESSGEGANVPLIDAPEGTLIDAPYQN